MIVDSEGYVWVQYRYDAYGNRTIVFDNSEGVLSHYNPYTYRGYRYDSEIGMYYLNSRYYNPQTGRFINADGMLGQLGDIQSTNMYAYCANNPVMYLDPSGEWAIFAAFASIGPVGWIAIAIIAIAAIYFSDEILNFVDTAIETTVSEFEKTLNKDYTVYSLVDSEGTIKYVGRVKTANYSARMAYHEKTKPGLIAGPKVDNLNYWECRGIEQLGIIGNSSGWFDMKTNPSGNKINGIGNLNPNRFDYYGAGIRYIWNNLENEWINLFH